MFDTVGAMRSRYPSRVGVLLAVVLLAGCGGSSPPQQGAGFKSGFGPIVNQFKQISRSIGMAVQQASSKTDAEIATTFRHLAAEWQSQVSRLETLTPPASLSVVFNTLTGATARVESDLNAVVSAALTHSKTAATQAGANLVGDILAAKSAATTITNRLGIKLR